MSDLDPREEQRLRALLDDAVAEVEPRHDLDSIRDRTKVTPMSSNRPWTWAAGGAVLATAATVAAFAFVNGMATEGADRDGDPAATTPAASSPAGSSPVSPTDSATDPTSGGPSPTGSGGAPAPTAVAPVYYVGPAPVGPRLFREFHEVSTAGGLARQALVQATGHEPLDPDYRSPWIGRDVGVESVEHAEGLVTVDLAGPDTLADRPAGMSEQEAGMAVEQLIYTVQAALQSGNDVPVQFLLNGSRVPSLLGVPTAEPLAAGDRMATLSTVWVTSPQDGDTVGRRFTVEGQGAFFEANVSWQLLRGDRVVKSGFATAEECCTLAPYSFVVTAAAGDYVLRVYDADMSGGEGPGEAEDTKRITVR